MKASKITPLLRFCTLHFTFYISLALPASAQTGNCPRAEGEAYLDAGNVRARILNNGGLFWRLEPQVYEVPKGSGLNSIFTSSIWIVGQVGGQLRAAATRYGEWEFWPGPLDQDGNPPADCLPYDRVWEIRTRDLQQYLDTGAISDNLRLWPWELGAPVVDGDGNPSNYNLAGGDLPELLGDQRLWWIMNDRGNEHSSSRTEPLGLEVHASAHAFTHPGFVGDITFYHHKLIYRNERRLTDAYYTLFADTDLGDFSDDYIGSDSLLHMGYTYNSDDFDGGGSGYGAAPPALGFTFLDTPDAPIDGLDNDRDGEIDEPGEMIGATSVLGGSIEIHEYPQPEILYNFMQGKWQNGLPVYEGLWGQGTPWTTDAPRKTTTFMFSGDPVTRAFWTELNMDDAGNALTTGDRKFIVTTGPFSMMPGDTIDIRFAIVWARGRDHLDSVTILKERTSGLHRFSESFYTFRPVATQSKPPLSNFLLGFDQNHPNPFTQTTSLRYSLPEPLPVRLSVYDVLGREVAVLVDAAQEPGIYSVDFDARGLPAGLYIARIQMGFLQYTKRMVKKM